MTHRLVSPQARYFADNMRKLRNGIYSQQQLASLALISPGTVMRYENYRNEPTIVAAKRIAVALGVSLDAMIARHL